MVFIGFVLYSTWAAFINANYYFAPYLSPFYSPCLATSCGDHANWAIVGSWWPLSPAILVLVFPLGFRLTCYYYRKAYYRSFWLSPPACAVAEPHARYTGETRFPLILQNIHRYFLYFARADRGGADPRRRRGVPLPGRVGGGARLADLRRERRAHLGCTRCRATRAGTCAAAG